MSDEAEDFRIVSERLEKLEKQNRWMKNRHQGAGRRSAAFAAAAPRHASGRTGVGDRDGRTRARHGLESVRPSGGLMVGPFCCPWSGRHTQERSKRRGLSITPDGLYNGPAMARNRKRHIVKTIRRMGIVRPIDLEEHGIPRGLLYTLVREGLVERQARGIYVSSGQPYPADHTIAP